jgi:hypothetical protein
MTLPAIHSPNLRVRDWFDTASCWRRLQLAEFAMDAVQPLDRICETVRGPAWGVVGFSVQFIGTFEEMMKHEAFMKHRLLFDTSLCPMEYWENGQYRRSIASRLPIWC